MVIDGKIYIGDQDGDVFILQAGKEKKELAKIDMGAGVTATFVPAHGTLYVNTMSQLFALASGATSSVAR
jgi:hypothetical protein